MHMAHSDFKLGITHILLCNLCGHGIVPFVQKGDGGTHTQKSKVKIRKNSKAFRMLTPVGNLTPLFYTPTSIIIIIIIIIIITIDLIPDDVYGA